MSSGPFLLMLDILIACRTVFTYVIVLAYIAVVGPIGLAIVLFAPNSQQIIDGRRMFPAEPPAFGRLRFHYGPATALAAGAALFFCLTLMADVREFVYFQF